MARLIDLDKIAPPDVTVRIDAQDYKLPGDLPTEMYLGILEAAERFEDAEDEDNAAAMRDLDARVLAAFQIRQPDLTVLPIGVTRIYALIISYYGGGGEEIPEDPPRAEEAPSTTKRKRSSASTAASRKAKTGT